MNKNLHLLSYNNYTNRTLKRFAELWEYNEIGAIIAANEGVSFDPGNDVFTSVIVNYDDELKPDYLLVCDEFNDIVSRWYIINSIRVRSGQYRLELLRDLLADYYNDVMKSPVFVEKGTALTDPYIYQHEEFSSNEIKTSETLLKDKSNSAWVVGYLAKNAPAAEGTDGKISIPRSANPDDAIYLPSTLEEWEFYNNILSIDGNIRPDYIVPYAPAWDWTWFYDGAYYYPTVANLTVNGETGNCKIEYGSYFDDYSGRNSLKEEPPAGSAKLSQAFKNYGLPGLYDMAEEGGFMTNVMSRTDYNELLAYDGKKIITADGKIYYIALAYGNGYYAQRFTISPYSKLGKALTQIYKNSGIFHIWQTDNYPTYMDVYALSIAIAVQRIPEEETTVEIPLERTKTVDAPYDIFAIPYGNVKIKNHSGTVCENTNKELAISAAAALTQNYQPSTSSGYLYDLQLLPYCPLQTLITDTGELTYKSEKDFSPIVDGDGNVLSGIFFVSSGSFSFNIYEKIALPASSIEQKIVNQCDKYRLCSPNYSNYFDFNLNQNGSINYFEIDCQYKPYTPYIHVAPEFGRLYGYDYDDPRGLILGGDFSLPQISSAWETYELQNKNYEKIFGRQMISLQTQQSVEREEQLWNTRFGVLTGGAAGATGGAMVGGGWGALAGGLVGGVASAFGASRDLELGDKLRKDTYTAAIDIHNYQLGNIKALPLTLSKVSSFTPNNKIFPVLEYYTCSREEKIALANKMKYEGMTIGVVGTMEDFALAPSWTYYPYGEDALSAPIPYIKDKGFFKGQLIQFIGTNTTPAITQQIAIELQKGVYLR